MRVGLDGPRGQQSRRERVDQGGLNPAQRRAHIEHRRHIAVELEYRLLRAELQSGDGHSFRKGDLRRGEQMHIDSVEFRHRRGHGDPAGVEIQRAARRQTRRGTVQLRHLKIELDFQCVGDSVRKQPAVADELTHRQILRVEVQLRAGMTAIRTQYHISLQASAHLRAQQVLEVRQLFHLQAQLALCLRRGRGDRNVAIDVGAFPIRTTNEGPHMSGFASLQGHVDVHRRPVHPTL